MEELLELTRENNQLLNENNQMLKYIISRMHTDDGEDFMRNVLANLLSNKIDFR